MTTPRSLGAVLEHVGAHVDDATFAAPKVTDRPWYVRAVVAVTIWVGALCLAGFLLKLDVLKNEEVQLTLGAILLGTAAVAARKMRGLARLHIVLIGYIAGNGALMVFLDKALNLRDESMFFASAVLQVVSMALIASRVVRFKAAIAGIGSFWGFTMETRIEGGVDLFVVVLAGVGALLWLFEAPLAAHRLGRLARSIAFATPLALLLILIGSVSGERDMKLAAPLLVSAALTALFTWAVLNAARELGMSRGSPVVIVTIVGALVLAALTFQVPGVLAAALVIALGRMRKEPILEIVGSAGLGIFLFALYRSLDLTLLWKAAAITGAGVVILALRHVALSFAAPVSHVDRAQPGTSFLSPILPAPTTMSRLRNAWRLALPIGLTVGVTLALVAQKEALLANGRTIYLELAPTDPRSLLQGDYMILDYVASRELARAATRWDEVVHGTAPFVVNERGIAQLAPTSSSAAGEDVVTLKYARHGYQVKLGAESFFFPEGRAALLSGARYAELRIDDDGNTLLVGLRDVDLRALDVRAPNENGTP